MLYKQAAFLGKNFLNKIRDLIDKYYIASYDFEVGYYKHNAKHFHAIYDEMYKVKVPKNNKAETAFGKMISLLTQIEDTRNKSSVISSERLTKGQWSILFALVGIILFSLFYLKVPIFHSQFFTVLLSTILILVILILRDLQNLQIAGESLLEESGQEVLEDIGKLRYYNEFFVKKGISRIPKHIKRYRLGLHKPGEKVKIKIVNR